MSSIGVSSSWSWSQIPSAVAWVGCLVWGSCLQNQGGGHNQARVSHLSRMYYKTKKIIENETMAIVSIGNHMDSSAIWE